MALAILELVSVDDAAVRFDIDLGTSTFYQLKIGRGVRSRAGMEWVDESYRVTPVVAAKRGDGFGTATKIAVPRSMFDQGEDAYVQLLSFKSKDGRSPAVSRVVRVPFRRGPHLPIPDDYVPPLSRVATMTPPRFRPARLVQGMSEAPAQPTLDDLLGKLVSAAAPVVTKLLQGATGGANQQGGGGAALLTRLLQLALGGSGGAPVPLVAPHSVEVNRFGAGGTRLAHPFIMGIDDAALAGLLGPALSSLPQLVTAVNAKRIEMKKADNKLVGDIVSDVNRRLMLQQILDAQRTQAKDAQPGGGVDLAQLLQLLQQAGVGGEAVGAAPAPQKDEVAGKAEAPAKPEPAPVVHGKSVFAHASSQPSPSPSSTAAVSFVTAPGLEWNGARSVLYAQAKHLELRVRLDVARAGKPIPKAIVKVCFKNAATQAVCCEKIFKQKDLAPNTVIALPFAAEELRGLPAQTPIAVYAEVRWVTAQGARYRAVGAMDMVVVGPRFVQRTGPDVSAERELVDMGRFRPFWNKLWEAPAVGPGAVNGAGDKRLWDLDVTARYVVSLVAGAEENGLVAPRLLPTAEEPEAVTLKTRGRLKAGIELSVAELAKLLMTWEGAKPLDQETLAALRTDAFARAHAGAVVTSLRMKGRAREQGTVWAVPVFKLHEITIGVVQTIDDAGQVTAATPESIQLPLPVAVRILALKTNRLDQPKAAAEPADGDGVDEEAGRDYQFDGYETVISQRLMLMPLSAKAARVEDMEGSMAPTTDPYVQGAA